MANYKVVDADQLDADLTTVSDAIRSKTGGTATLAFPDGMTTAINGIDTSVTPAITVSSAGLITATSGSKSSTKQLSTQAAKTVTPTTSAQTAVKAGIYITGDITVAGDANLVAENIVEDVSIFGIIGTATVVENVSATIINDSDFIMWVYRGYPDKEYSVATGKSLEITVALNSIIILVYDAAASLSITNASEIGNLSYDESTDSSCQMCVIEGDCTFTIK